MPVSGHSEGGFLWQLRMLINIYADIKVSLFWWSSMRLNTFSL